MSTYSVKLVSNHKELSAFIGFPNTLYLHSQFWTPQLYSERKELLKANKHPIHKNIKMKLFLGFKGGILSGQIAFIENPTHYEHWRQKTAFFGFYESVNDQNMSNLLFETVENEARKLSYESITGPFNPTINYTCGVLVNCFDKPNTLNMPYNYDYYDQLIINNNYQKAKDLLSFEVTRDKLKVFDIDKIPQSTEIHYRSANKAELDHEVLNMVKIFNNAWSNNWNFIPITEEETMHQAKSLKKILNTELMIMAEDSKNPIGFILALPDINPLIKQINGKLLPFGWLVILKGIKHIKKFRVITLGVVKDHQNSIIAFRLISKLIQNGIKLGYDTAELSWILEDNHKMLKPLSRIGATQTQRFRIYEKKLS